MKNHKEKMNNPLPKCFDHPDKPILFIEWVALSKLHFGPEENRLGPYLSIYDAYLGYDQSWGYWNDHFVTESRKRPNRAKSKLHQKILRVILPILMEPT